MFASRVNAKCKRYVSWKEDPKSFAIDAFTSSWKQNFFYAFPPLSIILRSLADASLKQYECCFKKWWNFCCQRKLNPFQNSISDILCFLTTMFENGAAHSSLNCYRSAIYLLIGPEVDQDHRVMRFFKGVYSLRPSKPKYDCTWDPKIVLNYLSSLPSNEEMPLKRLGMKLICLLALITGHRMQTFSLIKIENIEKQMNSVQIKIPDRIKTTGRNRNQPILHFPYYVKNKQICAATALDCYMRRTQSIRNNIASLFITSKRPYKPAKAQTLSIG